MEKELTQEELSNIAGGKLSKDAAAWVSRNEREIRKRADAAGLGSMANLGLTIAKTCSQTLEVSDLIDFIGGYGVDVSDLT